MKLEGEYKGFLVIYNETGLFEAYWKKHNVFSSYKLEDLIKEIDKIIEEEFQEMEVFWVLPGYDPYIHYGKLDLTSSDKAFISDGSCKYTVKLNDVYQLTEHNKEILKEINKRNKKIEKQYDIINDLIEDKKSLIEKFGKLKVEYVHKDKK